MTKNTQEYIDGVTLVHQSSKDVKNIRRGIYERLDNCKMSLSFRLKIGSNIIVLLVVGDLNVCSACSGHPWEGATLPPRGT